MSVYTPPGGMGSLSTKPRRAGEYTAPAERPPTVKAFRSTPMKTLLASPRPTLAMGMVTAPVLEQ